MVAKNEKSWTTPPITFVGLSKPQLVFQISDTNHTSNSITGILEDILPRLKAGLQDCHMLDLPFDDFLRRFVILEDANYARSSSNDGVAISARNPFNLSVHTATNLPQNTSKPKIVPWFCQQANTISASYLESLVSKKKCSSTKTPPYAEWFQHGKLPLGTDSKNLRKINFGLSWKEYRRLLHLKIAAKQVEESGAQRLIEPATKEAASAGYAVIREKYSPGPVGINVNTVDNCKSLDAQATLLGPLYCSSSLIGRRTQVWLAELTLSQKHEGFENQPSPTQIVIKIIAQDVEATLNKREILKKAASYGNIDVPWLVSHNKFTIQDCSDTTHKMILQNWEPVKETLRICRRREITMSKSIGVPLIILRPPPLRLLQIARDIIVTIKRLHEVDILHCNVSINNIMCTLKKGENIVLEGDAHITAKGPTLLAGRPDSRREVFLNDYDLATYASEASGMTTLTGTWAFIAPSRLEEWGAHHVH
ncbi:hypothetical protein MMC31_004825 [Peltigera leucophlebia]|nr:hypothetical protein [Peltigera leucophlebia]